MIGGPANAGARPCSSATARAPARPPRRPPRAASPAAIRKPWGSRKHVADQGRRDRRAARSTRREPRRRTSSPRRTCSPSPRSASSPATSASTSRRSPRAAPGGVVTREDVERARGRTGTRTGAPARRALAGRCPGCAGRARDPHPDQGRAQDDRRGDGRLRLHRAARHGVGHGRRHPHHEARRAAARRPRVRRREGCRRCSSSPRR